MSQTDLNRTSFWEDEPDDDHPPGSLYTGAPLLSGHISPITADDEWGGTTLYLPTLLDLAVLYRKFRDGWWFLPVTTAESFEHADTFDRLFEQVEEGAIRGWFALPPLDEEASPLSSPALVYLLRPTLLRPDLIEAGGIKPSAQLTDAALQELHVAVVRALEE
jgi:hypothetical protein